jgi:lipopolysaccharide/colanic/teichoic acid biosynthesis glycosyltransferase
VNESSYDPVKRVVDVAVSVTALLLTIPFQALIALLVRGKLGSPVLFRQLRPGKDERTFELLKFRTMLEPDEIQGLVTDADRMTSFGAFLRSTSIDELPSLWNVVKGDMSIVGPRPLLVPYLSRYTTEQRRRHEVRPGVTGLAQVTGRNAITWEEKFVRDVEYVDDRRLALDLWIVWRTVTQVLKRDGISATGSVTMAEFKGSPRG